MDAKKTKEAPWSSERAQDIIVGNNANLHHNDFTYKSGRINRIASFQGEYIESYPNNSILALLFYYFKG